MMMKSGSFKPKSYFYSHNLKNSKVAHWSCVIPVWSTPILYHKLPKSPVFLQATVYYMPSQSCGHASRDRKHRLHMCCHCHSQAGCLVSAEQKDSHTKL